jgi:hypothetical protein
MGIIVFYEGNNGSGHIVQTVEDVPGQNFKPINNDVIRSVKLYGVRPGCELSLFDSPEGATNDDFCIVNVKRTSPEYTVDTFERSYEDDYVVVSWIRNNGLDGQISRIKIN